MNPLFLNFWIAGGLLGALALAPKRPWIAAPALALIALVVGIARGFLVPVDLLHLPGWSGLSAESAALVAWGLWSGAARLAPAPWLPGPPVLAAGLSGALFGQVSGASLAASGVSDPRAAGRLALAAVGGGLIGRVGAPVLLALGSRVSALWFLPLGLLIMAVAAPGEALPRPAEGDRRVTAIGLIVALAASLAPGLAWAPVLVGALVLGGWGLVRKAGVAPLVRSALVSLGSVALVLATVSSGLLHYTAEAVQFAEGIIGPIHPALLALVGLVVGLLLDAPAAALLLAAFVDRAVDLPFTGFEVPLALGAAFGGLGPVRAVGRLREVRRRWLVAALLTLAWAMIAARFIPVD